MISLSLRDRLSLSPSRRDILRVGAFGLATSSVSGWMDALAGEAAHQEDRQARSCILLWLQGGPSHIDTFDPKPGSPQGGPFRAIPTSVPGIHICEKLPQLARQMDRMAIIRGMSTGEGSHQRATFLMHTGYPSGQPFRFPGLGAIVARENGDPGSDISSFVTLGNVRNGISPGYLGPEFAPLTVPNPDRGVDNLQPPVPDEQLSERIRLLDILETRFRGTHANVDPIEDHRSVYRKAVRLVRSPAQKAFDFRQESEGTRARYGDSRFGRACLVARRLVEAGVSFVEVPLGGWDTHKDNFNRLGKLLPQVDHAMSALLDDLDDRGLLDSTLVVCMGEFGRTPKINKNTGRDHYARAWSTVLAGGGLAGGQVVGKTDAVGAKVVEQPVGAPDFLATVCRLLDIDTSRSYASNLGRRIRIVKKDARPIESLAPTRGTGRSSRSRWF